jgi:hypothetical protein
MIMLLQKIKDLGIYTLIVLLLGAGGWELARRHYFKPPTKEVIITKTETKWAVKPIDATPAQLLDWSKSKIVIDYTVLSTLPEYTKLNVFAYDANKYTEQEIKVPVAESGNWKLYAAVGGIAAIMGGYAAYKIFK